VKREVVKAVGAILRQLNKLEDLDINPNRLSKLRRETIFFLYEGGGDAKWATDRPHSARAREVRRQMDSKAIPRAEGVKQFTYEHAVPLKTLALALRAASESDEELERFLDQHILGVVILRDEDDRLVEKGLRQAMPLDALPHDRLARYREAGIEFEPADLAKLRNGWSIHQVS
jgi:hypothetical protein